MSIKDLFGKTSRDLEETVQDVESVKFVEEKSKQQERYLPPVDFSDPKNFVYYGSAELYYDAAIRRIYEDYPYDGSKAEQIEFEEKSSHLERWLFDNRYPKTTGYVELGTTEDISNPTSGDWVVTNTNEYIRVWGGLHTDDVTDLKDKFAKSAKYDEGKNRNQNWNCDFDNGVTIEFWMKKVDNGLTVNRKEVILDLWNGIDPSIGSPDYSRLILSVFTQSTGATSINLEIKHEGNNSAASFSLVGPYDWNHYSISIKKDGTDSKCRFYVNGDSAANPQTLFSLQGSFSGKVDGFIGALQERDSFLLGERGSGKLSACLDEFRFWKTERAARQIKLNWFSQVGGGANTDDATSDLGVYFKFNEGVVGRSSTDSVVLDYSGRLANGLWVGYPGSSARNTGSAIEAAGYTEPATPIIYSNHPQVTALSSEMYTSGTLYDSERGQAFFNSMPNWLQQEDNGNLRQVSQILGSYLDTLHVQIKQMTELRNKDYTPEGLKASTMAQDLLKDKGFMTSNMFGMNEIYEKLSDLDIQDGQFESELNEIKNIIYTNIYNNLEKIYKSKGTETSIRNFIRCFGIDDELVKLNLYTDNGVQYLSDKSRVTSVKKKYINLNNPDYFSATIYQTSSADNPNTFISGSSAGTIASNNAFTLEADIVVPYKKEMGENGYFGTPFLSSSVFGFHEANEAVASDYTFASAYGMQVYLVKDSVHSRNAKFVLDLAGTQLESDYVYDIYENTHWNIAISIKPETYPYAGGVTNTTPDYEVSLYAVSHDMHEGSQDYNEVGIYATLGNADGARITNMAKRAYAGAHIENFTGSVLQKSDVEIGSIRGWLDYLGDEEIQNHNKDILNYGSRRSIDGSNIYTVDNKQIPTQDLTILNWDFDTVLASDVSGRFIVEDITSGSTDTIYGWVDDIIRREHRARGDFFPSEDSSFLSNEFLYSLKKQLPEAAYNSENIFIKGEQEINFSDDDDVSDNLFILEKSPANLVSEEMLKSFSTTMEFANLVGRPIDRYRLEYKDLAKARELFFNKVESDLDFDRFFEYFKWIDSSISSMVNQLIPLSANFAGGIVDVIEPHILERDKYQRQIGLLNTVTSTEASIRGVQELNYNWKFGHAPLPTERIGNGEGSFTFAFSAAQDGDTITISGKTFEINKSGGVTPGNIELTFYTLKGINNANIRSVIATEFPNFTVTMSNNVNNPVYTIVDPSGNLTITTSSTGTFSAIILVQSSFFEVDEAENCLWQKERKERSEVEREQIRQVLVRQTDQEFTNPINLSGSDGVYQGRTYATRRLSKPYSVNIGLNNSIHGGINYDKNKNRDFFKTVITPNGQVGSSGAPKNIMTIGAGDGHGLNALVDCNDVENPNALIKRDGEAQIGKFSSFAPTTLLDPLNDSLHYLFKRKLSTVFPGNIVSSSVNTGYASRINKSGLSNGFKEGVNVVNLHSDTTDITNEIPIQGPFTQQWVGGQQSRHVNIATGPETLETRPEAWRLLIGTNPFAAPGDTDGAMGFTGPDYGSPYPVSGNQKAIYYREERAKRPVNIKNIQTLLGTGSAGNYVRGYEFLSTFGDQKYFLRRHADENLLPPAIAESLPQTTNYQTLIAQTSSVNGNFFGAGNARQHEQYCIIIPGTDPVPTIFAERATGGSFSVSGTTQHVVGDYITIDGRDYEIDTGVQGGSTIQTNNSNDVIQFYDNLKTELENQFGNDFTVSYSDSSTRVETTTSVPKVIFYGRESGAHLNYIGIVSWSPLQSGFIGHSNSTSLPITFSFFIEASPNDGLSASSRTIYSEKTTPGMSTSIKITQDGGLLYTIVYHYISNSHALRTTSYLFENFMSLYASTETHVIITTNGVLSSGQNDTRLYINGALQAWDYSPGNPKPGSPISFDDFSATTNTVPVVEKFFIGNDQSGLNPLGQASTLNTLPTTLDEFMIFDKFYGGNQALINEIYNGGHPWVYATMATGKTTYSDLKAFYTFTEPNDGFDHGDYIYNRITNSPPENLRVQKTTNFSVTNLLADLDSRADFTIEPTLDGEYGNFEIVLSNGTSFSDAQSSVDGVDFVAGVEGTEDEQVCYGTSNIVSTQNRSTGSINTIRTIFSAPGGPEINTSGYLDIATQQYSVYNSINFRNLTVRASGSGEQGTIRVNSHSNRREGLRTLRARHQGQFGIDSQHGAISATDYVAEASFHKQHRNTTKQFKGTTQPDGTPIDGAVVSRRDNDNFTSLLPGSDFQYSWINSAISGSNWEDQQRVLGFAPPNGLISSSIGITEAIVFPTISEIECDFCLEIPGVDLCYTPPNGPTEYCDTPVLSLVYSDPPLALAGITLDQIEDIWGDTTYTYACCDESELQFKIVSASGSIQDPDFSNSEDTGWSSTQPDIPAVTPGVAGEYVYLKMQLKDCNNLEDSFTLSIANLRLTEVDPLFSGPENLGAEVQFERGQILDKTTYTQTTTPASSYTVVMLGSETTAAEFSYGDIPNITAAATYTGAALDNPTLKLQVFDSYPITEGQVPLSDSGFSSSTPAIPSVYYTGDVNDLLSFRFLARSALGDREEVVLRFKGVTLDDSVPAVVDTYITYNEGATQRASEGTTTINGYEHVVLDVVDTGITPSTAEISVDDLNTVVINEVYSGIDTPLEYNLSLKEYDSGGVEIKSQTVQLFNTSKPSFPVSDIGFSAGTGYVIFTYSVRDADGILTDDRIGLKLTSAEFLLPNAASMTIEYAQGPLTVEVENEDETSTVVENIEVIQVGVPTTGQIRLSDLNTLVATGIKTSGCVLDGEYTLLISSTNGNNNLPLSATTTPPTVSASDFTYSSTGTDTTTLSYAFTDCTGETIRINLVFSNLFYTP